MIDATIFAKQKDYMTTQLLMSVSNELKRWAEPNQHSPMQDDAFNFDDYIGSYESFYATNSPELAKEIVDMFGQELSAGFCNAIGSKCNGNVGLLTPPDSCPTSPDNCAFVNSVSSIYKDAFLGVVCKTMDDYVSYSANRDDYGPRKFYSCEQINCDPKYLPTSSVIREQVEYYDQHMISTLPTLATGKMEISRKHVKRNLPVAVAFKTEIPIVKVHIPKMPKKVVKKSEPRKKPLFDANGNQLKRPMNPFMLYRKANFEFFRKQLCKTSKQNVSSVHVSGVIGRAWRSEPDEVNAQEIIFNFSRFAIDIVTNQFSCAVTLTCYTARRNDFETLLFKLTCESILY